ncbi:hypothetical protein SPF06_09470 [Sinomonas sp. JGH33]|uniref:Sortase n=1 Tax=Sinomonas terricola TaxID=3110330 RepID=A0ABU5T5K3_9MICC|nr:hypothetical protein [Sinomonas sp. JGH33]MEA5454948.1 hypothetical protein [Sinomonas sp. JGH33]
MLKKSFAILTIAVVALLGVQPSAASAAGPLPIADRGQDDGHGQGGDRGRGEDHGHGGYVPHGSITISGLPIPGGTIIIIFGPSSFRPGEQVTITVGDRTVGGGHHVTLGAVMADVASTEKQAADDGSLNVTMKLPSDAAGTQEVTATGVSSGNVGTAATTVVPPDSAANAVPASLTTATATLPLLLIWVGTGALALAVAAVGTLAFVRRQRQAA